MSLLDGVRVIDCTLAMAGPFAAQRLGDLGADVIKVEPVTGEWSRHVAHPLASGKHVNPSVLSLNRNKRSLAIDLKTRQSREVMRRLVATADVFLQNFRPSVADRLGIDYDSLRHIKPDLVYVSISGYGRSGSMRGVPGQDLLLQAMSGLMYSAGVQSGPPQPAGLYVVDAVTGYTAFEGALAALYHRERTGEGQSVEVNMLDSIICLQMQEMSLCLVGGLPQKRGQEAHGHVYVPAPYGIFKTADGYIALSFPPLKQLGDLIGSHELQAMDPDARYTEHDAIHRAVSVYLERRTTEQWLDLFRAHDVWAGPVLTYDQVVNHPQVATNNSFVTYDHPTEGRVTTPGFPIRFSAAESKVRLGAPLAGQHTSEILKELGYDTGEVDELHRTDVVMTTALP